MGISCVLYKYPPSLPTNSSPFLEKRDCGQGLRACVPAPRQAACSGRAAQKGGPAQPEAPWPLLGARDPSPILQDRISLYNRAWLGAGAGVTGTRTPHPSGRPWPEDRGVTLGTLALCWRVAAAPGQQHLRRLQSSPRQCQGSSQPCPVEPSCLAQEDKTQATPAPFSVAWDRRLSARLNVGYTRLLKPKARGR